MARILIIDDDPSGLELLVECLSGMGHEIDGAAGRHQAEALLNALTYELVISDLRLTGATRTDGLEVLAGVRVRCPAARLLLVSAEMDENARAAARKTGVDGCLAKPLELTLLRKKVEELMAPSPVTLH